MVQYPESYDELDATLNCLSSACWRSILRAKQMGGDERVIRFMRRELARTLRLWSDEELADYLIARNLQEDFEPVNGRW